MIIDMISDMTPPGLYFLNPNTILFVWSELQEGLKAWVNRSIRPSGSAGLTGLDEAERNFCLLEVVCVLSSRLGRPFDLQGCNILIILHELRKWCTTWWELRCMLHGIILARQDVTRWRAPSRPAEIISNERRQRPAEQRWPVTNALRLPKKSPDRSAPLFPPIPVFFLWTIQMQHLPSIFMCSTINIEGAGVL